jgi:ribonuclease VapC
VGDFVLDASAVIALLRGEKGADVVASAIPGATMSTVNVSEVASWLVDAGTTEKNIRLTLEGLELELSAFNGDAAYAAAALRKATRKKGISFGDRACLELGKRLALPVLTADRTWAELDIGVEVRLIRE